jgi:hypothetical protein
MPFKSDLDNTPIDMTSVMYSARPDAAWTSLISVQLTVLTAAKTLSELLAAKDTDVVNEVVVAADGTTMSFSGTLAPHTTIPRTSEIEDGDSVTFTATVSAGGVDITDAATPGILAGTNCTGTINYETGAWTLVFTVTAPDNATNIVVDYTWFFVLPSTAQGLWMYPAGDVRATFSANGVPTASTGMLIDEAVMLAGQRNLMLKASFIAGSSTLLDVEILV